MVIKNKQSGVVLIVALVFLAALTGVAAALMNSTSVDMKMAGASQDKVEATQQAIGANDQVIFKQVNKTDAVNHFTSQIAVFPVTVAVDAHSTDAKIVVNNPNNLQTGCPRDKYGSGIKRIECNHLQVVIEKKYGRRDNNEVEVRAGVSQQVLKL